MKALVTGSAGFVGRHMVAHLIRTGWDVVGVDIAPGRYGWQAGLSDWLRNDAEWYDLVVHAAAESPHRAAIDTELGMHVRNTHLDADLFDWAVRTSQRRVLYFSSCAVLDSGSPLDGYGRVKLHGEFLAAEARRAGVPTTVVRPFSGYGMDQSTRFPFGAFLQRALRKEDPFTVWGDGRQVRDWVHIDDVVHESMMAVDCGTTEPVSLCTGVGTSMAELAHLMCAEAGYSPEFKFMPGHHAGVARRVGTPGFRRPKISIAEGVRRAVHG